MKAIFFFFLSTFFYLPVFLAILEVPAIPFPFPQWCFWCRCTVDFELGSHLRIVVVSVTEGDDTVEKHPIIFQTSDVVVINKIDLADAVGADADKMVADAQKLNPKIKIIKSSLKEGKGLDEIISTIEEAMN